MSAFYDEMAAVALGLLAEFGAPISFSRTVGAVKNPATGAVITPGSTTAISVSGVIVPIKSNLIDGTRILAGDKRLIVPASDVVGGAFAPLMTDKIAGWSIQEIEDKNPAGTPLVYFIRVRK